MWKKAHPTVSITPCHLHQNAVVVGLSLFPYKAKVSLRCINTGTTRVDPPNPSTDASPRAGCGPIRLAPFKFPRCFGDIYVVLRTALRMFSVSFVLVPLLSSSYPFLQIFTFTIGLRSTDLPLCPCAQCCTLHDHSICLVDNTFIVTTVRPVAGSIDSLVL